MITLSSPRFAGQKEYEAYLKKMREEFTPPTVDTLAESPQIQKTDSFRHIAVASRLSEDLQNAETTILNENGYNKHGQRLNRKA